MNAIIKQLAEQAGMNIKTNVIGTALVFGTFEGYKTSHITIKELEKFAELVTAQEREWQGLTDEEIHDCFQNRGRDGLKTRKLIAAAIEAMLKEKNT